MLGLAVTLFIPMFLIARFFSFLGRKWSIFAHTTRNQDLVASLVLSIVVTIIITLLSDR